MSKKYIIKSFSFLLAALAITLSTGFIFQHHKSQAGKEADKAPVVLKAIPKTNLGVALAAPGLQFEQYIANSYQAAGLANQGLPLETYRKAVTGYHNLMAENLLSVDKPLITIVDFNQSSKNRRLWVINLATNQVVYNTWVAHGQGSGLEYAARFSNTPDSYQSSLGFYLTQETYTGKNGYSLKLQGLDAGFNTNALERSVVVHGAAYATDDFIKANGRLGRSQGCPALSPGITRPIINTIKYKTLLFIDGPSESYSSAYLNVDQAALCYRADLAGKGHINV